MGYERNDRRYGQDRNERDYSRAPTADRYQGDSYRRDEGRWRDTRDQSGRYDPEERGFFDRAGDEVRSWFGDDEAERRRRLDERHDERADRYDQRGDPRRDDMQRDWRDPRSGNRFADYDRPGASGYGQRSTPGVVHDHNYHSWRDRQIDALDRDYDEYRREHQSKFESEFGSWRQGRQGQRDSLQRVREHMEVVGSDGAHVGKVDHVRGDRILLAKNDQTAGGHHHSIPSRWIVNVGDKVEIAKTAEQAMQAWRDEEDTKGGGLFGRDEGGAHNLNRSFSGTY